MNIFDFSKIINNLIKVECFGENNVCIITPTCQLKTILADALEQFFLKLDEYTLADLIFEQESEILNLLSIRDL